MYLTGVLPFAGAGSREKFSILVAEDSVMSFLDPLTHYKAMRSAIVKVDIVMQRCVTRKGRIGQILIKR